uniref:Uncharacterized protein n=1 Tax=Anguilla anguilla TaxID=7936 RepID=A0A0E9XQS3_ANGAN
MRSENYFHFPFMHLLSLAMVSCIFTHSNLY